MDALNPQARPERAACQVGHELVDDNAPEARSQIRRQLLPVPLEPRCGLEGRHGLCPLVKVGEHLLRARVDRRDIAPGDLFISLTLPSLPCGDQNHAWSAGIVFKPLTVTVPSS